MALKIRDKGRRLLRTQLPVSPSVALEQRKPTRALHRGFIYVWPRHHIMILPHSSPSRSELKGTRWQRYENNARWTGGGRFLGD
ncbi:hypothetical protein E2C01_002865 [Portunus trituberculatus]|uniref:Uncharacterized protein n=1 Tax=Portunus trituberculatus TaxID=210409 RepID=A0A5B7CRU3_PORTR|nr:hypothetical protein [Portunus trituberculatus]